jgi:hypothetical protein
MKRALYHPEVASEGSNGHSGGGTLIEIARAWDRFFFKPADPLPLGVIRMFTGVVILYVHLIYSLDLLAMVGPDGWLNKERVNEWRYRAPFQDTPSDWSGNQPPMYKAPQPVWSVYFHLEEPAWIIATHVGFLVAMFLFTIGLGTRLMGVVTWVAIISYIQRLPTFLYGMDTIMNVVIVYLMISPCGAAFSVDRVIAKWWAKRKGKVLPPPQPLVSANFALRMMQIHFCFIYLASGVSKLQGPAWWNGTALWGTLANYSFAPMNWQWYVDFLRWLCDNRFLWEVLMFTGTYFTLFLEISFPYLIWQPRLRWFMICCSVLMHTGIGLIMGLTTFSLMMLCLVLAFVPASTHHAFVEVMRQQGMTFKQWLRGKSAAKPHIEQPALAAGA